MSVRVLVVIAIIIALLIAGVLAFRAGAATVPASNAFDTCPSCFGQDPQQPWFTAEHKAGYDLMIIDPDTWNSEFPNGNTNDPGPASGCQLAADSKQLINNAIYAGMKVMIYNRNLNCYGTISQLGPKEKAGTPDYVWDVETSPGLVPSSGDISAVSALGYNQVVYTWDGAVPQNLNYLSGDPLYFNEVSNWSAGPCSGGNPCPYPTINSIQPFDGWNSADIEQQGTGTLNGLIVDYDSVNTAWLATQR
jgi:hypothetical protein